MKDAKQMLVQALTERTEINASYSMRAFARDLGMSPQQLSNVLNGRRGLGQSVVEKVAQKLSFSETEKEFFLNSLKAEFSRSKTHRLIAKAKLKSLRASKVTTNLNKDIFNVIANWHHFALIELIKISPSSKNSTYAKRLHVTAREIDDALERLQRLGLVRRVSDKWVANQDAVIADNEISSEAIRNYHKQILEKSITALTFQSSSERYGSSSTIPFKAKDLARARKLIQDFRLLFDEEISDSTDGEEVYSLSIQFFRLTETIKEKI